MATKQTINMDWKKPLRNKKLAWMKEHHREFYEMSGGDKQRLKEYSDATTNGLTNCVFDWLKYHNHWVNRINSTGVARKINNKLVYTKSATNRGTADLTTIIDGNAVMIEIKNIHTNDRLSKYQEQEKQRIENSGGNYIVVQSMQDFVSWYEEFITQNEDFIAVTTRV